jgi:hypothetical protein
MNKIYHKDISEFLGEYRKRGYSFEKIEKMNIVKQFETRQKTVWNIYYQLILLMIDRGILEASVLGNIEKQNFSQAYSEIHVSLENRFSIVDKNQEIAGLAFSLVYLHYYYFGGIYGNENDTKISYTQEFLVIRFLNTRSRNGLLNYVEMGCSEIANKINLEIYPDRGNIITRRRKKLTFTERITKDFIDHQKDKKNLGIQIIGINGIGKTNLLDWYQSKFEIDQTDWRVLSVLINPDNPDESCKEIITQIDCLSKAKDINGIILLIDDFDQKISAHNSLKKTIEEIGKITKKPIVVYLTSRNFRHEFNRENVEGFIFFHDYLEPFSRDDLATFCNDRICSSDLESIYENTNGYPSLANQVLSNPDLPLNAEDFYRYYINMCGVTDEQEVVFFRENRKTLLHRFLNESIIDMNNDSLEENKLIIKHTINKLAGLGLIFQIDSFLIGKQNDGIKEYLENLNYITNPTARFLAKKSLEKDEFNEMTNGIISFYEKELKEPSNQKPRVVALMALELLHHKSTITQVDKWNLVDEIQKKIQEKEDENPNLKNSKFFFRTLLSLDKETILLLSEISNE